jgi:thiol-disulfide isomerase/thioredoxin
VTETGDTVSIAYYNTGYILLDFWYSSCEPCLKALPEINQMAKDYSEEGLTVMGINCIDKAISASLAAKLRAKNITIPLLFGGRDLLQSLKMNAFPTYILITPDRKVEVLWGSVEEVKSVVEAIFEK